MASGVGGAVQGSQLNFYGDNFYSSGAPTAFIRVISNDGGGAGQGTFTFSNHNGTSCTDKLKIYSTGNTVIQNGGTFIDAGFRLDVNGTARVQGTTTITGSTGVVSVIARGANITSTLIASANSDVLIGLDINATYTNGAFTGVRNIALRTITGDVLLCTTSGNVAIGTSTLATATELTLGGSQTASSAIARGGLINTTLVAAANNDVLVGLDITPTYINGAFTGVRNIALRTITGDVLLCTTSGNVGIGTAAPTSYSGFTTLNINNATNGGVIDLLNNGTRVGTFFNTSTYVAIGSTANVPLYFYANNSEAMRITAAGNVLINTQTDAGFRLDVNGTARVQGNTTITGTLTTTSNATTNQIGTITNAGDVSTTNFGWRNSGNFVRVQSSFGNFLFNSTLSNGGVSGQAGNSDSGWYFGTAGADSKRVLITNSNATGGTIYIANNGANVLNISTSNNVLINTTTDAGFRLDVNGTARVQGELTVNTVQIGLGGGAIATNTRVGLNTLGVNTTGNSNTAIGTQALQANTTGSENTALGKYALLSNTTGSDNTALGNSALRLNNTNGLNVAIGAFSLDANTGSNNTATGSYSLTSNTTGAGNVASGLSALFANTTGSNNTAFGTFAGRYISGGSTLNTITDNSIYLGYNTKALADNQTNQIVIGYNVTGLGSNTTVLGNTSTTLTALYGAVITGGTSVNASAQLQVDSTVRGFLPPRMTSAQRTAIGTPATGLIVYQTDGVEGLWLNTSTGWRELTVV
jgi:hypothetical protein